MNIVKRFSIFFGMLLVAAAAAPAVSAAPTEDVNNLKLAVTAFGGLVILVILLSNFAHGTHSATGRNKEERSNGWWQIVAVLIIVAVLLVIAPDLDFTKSTNLQSLGNWAKDNVITRTGGG